MESNQEVRHEFDVPNTIHIRIIEYRNKDKSTMGKRQNKSEGSITESTLISNKNVVGWCKCHNWWLENRSIFERFEFVPSPKTSRSLQCTSGLNSSYLKVSECLRHKVRAKVTINIMSWFNERGLNTDRLK